MSFENDYRYFAFSRADRVLTVTLNRPEKFNAIAGDMHRELSRLFYDVAADEGSEVIVITGAGQAFSAGGDLDYFEECRRTPALFRQAMREAKWIVDGLLDCDKPVICRMNGDAVGLGATIALFCDVIIAADTARIGDPHVKVGFVAGDGGAVIWPQLIGYARAKQFLLTGDLLTANEARDIGLINFSVPAAELDATVDRWAKRLASGATLATRWTKATINVGLKQLAASMMDIGIAYEGLSGRSDDHGEAIAAMRERRKPNFARN
ncbi:MAG: enoyl-CoA hydratase/isomerase family protein [Rhizobiaceae bacterium]|nr:enoyl-CoA hydratase/isomerase family protein [Rhizobiaceae bacterium]